MKNTALVLVVLCSFSTAWAQFNLEFVRGSGSTDSDYGEALSTDSNDNIYVIGGAADSISLSGDLAYPINPEGGIFVAKYDPTGNVVWGFVIVNEIRSFQTDIIVDSNDDVLITGSFGGMVDFDPDPVDEFILDNTSNDHNLFVAKYTNDGDFVWAFKVAGNEDLWSLGITHDNFDNVYITGMIKGVADFDPDLSSIAEISATVGGMDIFIAKYSSSGEYVWAHSLGGIAEELGFAIAADNLNNIYITGQGGNFADFDPDPNEVSTFDTIAQTHIFLAKYTQDGNFEWVHGFGSVSTNVGWDIDIDPLNNIYIAGYFFGSPDMDPSPTGVNQLTSNGKADAFVAKFSSTGEYQWASSVGGPGDDVFYSVVAHGQSGIYLAGWMENSIDADPAPTTSSWLTSNGWRDIFLSQYSSSGQYLGALNIGAVDGELVYDVAVSSGQPVITGFYESMNIDFDPSSTDSVLNNFGEQDYYLAKFSGFTVSLDQAAADQSIVIYPNPTTKVFRLKHARPGKVYIYSLQGQLLLSERVSTHDGEIHIGQLPKAHYVVRFLDDTGKSYHTSLVKI